MSDERELLRRTAEIAADFVESLDERPVWPSASVEELREALGGTLPDGPSDPRSVIEDLAEAAGKGVVAIPSGRYFGFVIGGSVPAALAADWLASMAGVAFECGYYDQAHLNRDFRESSRGTHRGEFARRHRARRRSRRLP